MEQPNLKPIPIPPKQQWREFRVAYLPVLTFAMLVVLIGWMWVRYVQPATIIGEVETVRANIISIAAGTVAELKVDRLESVTNGQELAIISVLDPDQVNAEVAAAEAGLRLMKARMDLDKARNVDSYSRLREELLVEQLNLELARIKLAQAETEFERAKRLFESELIPRGAGTTRNDFGYDVAVRDRDALRAEVASHEKTVAELQTGVDRLQAAGAADVAAADPAIEQAIAAGRERIQRLQQPVSLRSPINGFVSGINHLPGEKVTAGQNILVVSAEKSSRIVAWVRQPVTVPPQVGDIVQVRRATVGQPEFEATVVKVGKQLEEINPTAVPISATIQRAEFGLPLIVKVDEKLKLIPGEGVQLRVVRHAAAAN
jgi:multidrug resistance efflux pump